MTDQDPTLKDVWQLLVSFDRQMTERFDAIERRIVASNDSVSAFEAGIGAKLDALKDSIGARRTPH